MGNSLRRISHGFTIDEAFAGAVAFITAHGYVILRRADTVDPIRCFLFLEGNGWYEFKVEKGRHPPPGTFIASLIYVAPDDAGLQCALGDVRITHGRWKWK